MKATEIKPCALCRRGILHAGVPVFFRVTIEHAAIDMRAVRRQHGLEMMLDSAALAAVMGPNEDIGKVMHKSELVLCHDCALKPETSIGQLWEVGNIATGDDA